ncbi:zinc metalloprotease HtpX [Natrialba sp. SSL1]|uniref:zinc metalloprotease HtpX n=1 Tax=Natrialba sp. SSL1 TaxID=1869245 RepID=UPI0008F85FC4|nr:zinc metalloprotease HtpX [Natrialba sp. SSL1]OIB55612.1 zinc metalloprotease HtpX [Natrialba sp. SSL1]
MNWQPDWGLRGRMFVTMFLLFALYIVFAGVLTLYIGGGPLMIVVLFGGFSLVQYFFSDTLTLRSMGAKEVSADEYPQLHSSVERLSQQADLPKPTVAVVDSNVPNAFATGRNQRNAAVAVTSGLMNTLDREELDGVIAHELAHVKNRDMMVMTIASFLSTIAFMIVRWGAFFGGGHSRGGGGGKGGAGILVAILVSLVVWIISYVLIRALSRYREFAADRGAAAITGNPSALASALLKISGEVDKVPDKDMREEAEMNAFFIIPLKSGVVGRLFSTHPSTERRVEQLRELEQELTMA